MTEVQCVWHILKEEDKLRFNYNTGNTDSFIINTPNTGDSNFDRWNMEQIGYA